MSKELDLRYEKFYIPSSHENHKILGFERDEILLSVSAIFMSIFFSSFLLMILAVYFSYRYKKFKSGKFHFLQNIKYRRFYDFMGLKFLPRPSIKKIYGV